MTSLLLHEPTPASAEVEPKPGRAARHVFVVEACDGAEALLRVLGVFAVQGVRVAALSASGADGGAIARLEVEGLDARRAEHLRHRLARLPAVSNVAFGWRL